MHTRAFARDMDLLLQQYAADALAPFAEARLRELVQPRNAEFALARALELFRDITSVQAAWNRDLARLTGAPDSHAANANSTSHGTTEATDKAGPLEPLEELATHHDALFDDDGELFLSQIERLSLAERALEEHAYALETWMVGHLQHIINSRTTITSLMGSEALLDHIEQNPRDWTAAAATLEYPVLLLERLPWRHSLAWIEAIGRALKYSMILASGHSTLPTRVTTWIQHIATASTHTQWVARLQDPEPWKILVQSVDPEARVQLKLFDQRYDMLLAGVSAILLQLGQHWPDSMLPSERFAQRTREEHWKRRIQQVLNDNSWDSVAPLLLMDDPTSHAHRSDVASTAV